MRWVTKKNYYFFQIGFYALTVVMLMVSEFLEDWFEFNGVKGCEWKGSDLKVYSSDCYSEKSYADSKCLSHLQACSCCGKSGLASLSNLEKVSMFTTVNFSVVIFWIVIMIFLNIVDIYCNLKIYWKVSVGINTVFGVMTMYFTSASVPADVDFKSGYVLRLTSIMLFMLVCLVHLVIGCRVMLTKPQKPKECNELLNVNLNERRSRESKSSDKESSIN